MDDGLPTAADDAHKIHVVTAGPLEPRVESRLRHEVIQPDEPNEDDYALIPQYDVKGSCGNGHLNGHVEVKGGLVFRRDWMARMGVKPSRSAVIYASGDSMTPTIDDGDVVLIDLTQTEPRNGQIYVFLVDGEVRIKRVFRTMSGQWMLSSDNPNKTLYPDEPIEDPTVLSIIGRCVWQGGAL